MAPSQTFANVQFKPHESKYYKVANFFKVTKYGPFTIVGERSSHVRPKAQETTFGPMYR